MTMCGVHAVLKVAAGSNTGLSLCSRVSCSNRHNSAAKVHTSVFIMTCLWGVAPTLLRGVIAFVASFAAADWHPCCVKATWDIHAPAYLYVPLISNFLHPTVLGKAYISYAALVKQVIGDILPFTAKKVRVATVTPARILLPSLASLYQSMSRCSKLSQSSQR